VGNKYIVANIEEAMQENQPLNYYAQKINTILGLTVVDDEHGEVDRSK
jgi:hypothetical protein